MSSRKFCAPVLASLAACLAGPAAAGDWTQAYIGLGIGADVLTGQGQFIPTTGGTLNGSAPIGGDVGLSVTAGFDYQLNGFMVAGAFVNYDWSNIDTSASLTAGGQTLSASLFKVDQAYTVGGRLGVLATPETLIYALAGYSWLAANDITVSLQGQSQTFALPDAQGWTVGGGFEHKLNQNVSLRGEYRYTDFGQEILFNDPNVGVASGEMQSHSARLVAAYRFGGGAAEAATQEAVPVHNWTGAYIGGGIGVDAFVRDIGVDAVVRTRDIHGELNGLGGGGFSGTVTAGYDHMIAPQFLVGILGSYDRSASQAEVGASIGGNSVSAELLSLDQSWTIGARAGWALTGDVLVYGLAGYTRVSLSDTTVSGAGQSLTLNFPSLDGITFGGGFEKMISDTLSLRAEYRYTALEDTRIAVVPGVADMTIDSSMHSAKLIATYRFIGGTSP
jgi:outer membrane immunogenic protein